MIEKTWDVKEVTANKYIKQAANILSEDNYNVEEMRALNNIRLDDLYDKAVVNDKIGDALKAVDLLNKTNGVYTQKIEVTAKEFKVEFDYGDD